MEALAAEQPDAIIHVGFGLGLLGMNEALRGDRVDAAAVHDDRVRVRGDQRVVAPAARRLDRPRPVRRAQRGRSGLPRPLRSAPRTPARVLLPALLLRHRAPDDDRHRRCPPADRRSGSRTRSSGSRCCPAATGAPGTRLRFGRYIRNGWVGSEFLVARRVLPDGSRSVLHGTIEGLVEPGCRAAVHDDSRRAVGHRRGRRPRSLRDVIDDPDLDLVGLFVYEPGEGRRRRRHARRSRADGRARDERQVGDPRARRRRRAARREQGVPRATRTPTTSSRCWSPGKSVITTTSYNHLPTFGAETAERIDDACERAGTRFHAAGEHPGFMFERLATSVTGLVATRRQDHRAGVRRLLGR